MSTRYWLDANGDWNNTANWSGATVPITGDTVYILSGSQNIATNLNQSSVALANLVIGMGFTGTIGTSSAYLQISATKWTIGAPQSGNAAAVGSGRIKIDFGSNAYSGIVLGVSNTTSDIGYEAVRILGSNAGNVLVMEAAGGTVGVGTTLATETANVSEADVSAGTLNYGYGVTAGTVNVSANATFNTNSVPTTVTVAAGGTATIGGLGEVTTANSGGTMYLNNRPASGSMAGTVNIYYGGTVDFSKNSVAATVDTLNHYKGGTLNVNPAKPGAITFTTRNLINGGTLVLS